MADPVTEFEEYRQELLAELSGDDPVAVLRTTFDEVPRLVDLVVGTRIRMILTQNRPTIVGYDQEAWTARFGGLDAAPQDIVERWQALRKCNLRILESLTEAEWERVGMHTERGEESARLNVELMAGHDRAHPAQFRRGLFDD